MSTLTAEALIERFNIDIDPHLERSAEVAVISGLQFQGDVGVIPAPDAEPATTPVPIAGVPVVRGEAGGNTHAVVADGAVFCDVREADASDLKLAVLTVAEGATAYLAHPEHGYSGIGPGTYNLTRQREQADEVRMVAD